MRGLAIALLFAGVCHGAEITYAQLLEAGKREKENRIAELEKVTKAPVNTFVEVTLPGQKPDKVYASKGRQDAALSAIAELKKQTSWLPTFRMEPGSIGLMREEGKRLGEVADDSPKIRNVIDADTLYVHSSHGYFLIESIPTANRADGQALPSGMAFQFIGSKSFLPPGGKVARTVFVVRPFDLEAARQAHNLDQAVKSEDEKKTREANRKYTFFEMKDGRTIVAAMVMQEGDNYTVQTDTGETVKFTKDDIVGKSVKAKP